MMQKDVRIIELDLSLNSSGDDAIWNCEDGR